MRESSDEPAQVRLFSNEGGAEHVVHVEMAPFARGRQLTGAVERRPRKNESVAIGKRDDLEEDSARPAQQKPNVQDTSRYPSTKSRAGRRGDAARSRYMKYSWMWERKDERGTVVETILTYGKPDREVRLKVNMCGGREQEMRRNKELQAAVTEARNRAERRCRRDEVSASMRVTVTYHENDSSTGTTTREPVVGSSPTARRDRATVLPTVAFYASGSSTGGLDERGVRIVGRPSAPSMGIRSIGSVDGARHTATTEFEDRHGSALPTKTSDVHATRAAKASLSRTKKKALTRKVSRSSSHMRSRERKSDVVHLEDGEIAPDGSALDVRGRAATTADSIGREGAEDAVAGQKRRGGVLIVHGNNTDVAPGRDHRH
ncbi:hypothetical protein CBR_g26000 [Chara braunii]|uniref:Uncharacterized protein n=1 Tax=Chara braunii TaxID=69332 RepID=A0A388L786_CHABU|nr:hypothetical protein CBR_g26000 [Chara braunii]|eukprot:GBG78063.1 hypothetical protein CBR_g26000 [Chara braunii]